MYVERVLYNKLHLNLYITLLVMNIFVLAFADGKLANLLYFYSSWFSPASGSLQIEVKLFCIHVFVCVLMFVCGFALHSW